MLIAAIEGKLRAVEKRREHCSKAIMRVLLFLSSVEILNEVGQGLLIKLLSRSSASGHKFLV